MRRVLLVGEAILVLAIAALVLWLTGRMEWRPTLGKRKGGHYDHP